MDDLREEIGEVRTNLAVHVATCEGLHRDTNKQLGEINDRQKWIMAGIVGLAVMTMLEPHSWVPILIMRLGG